MKKRKPRKSEYDENPYFVRIYRSTVSDYLNDKKLTVDEFFVLIWLHLRANPFNGVVNTSYDAIRMELSGKYSKNEINKICLSLKQKKFIYFEKQQGRRSSFIILIANYPLVSGSFKDISHLNETLHRSIDKTHTVIPAEVRVEVEPTLQKFEQEETIEKSNYVEDQNKPSCRSANIETDNKIDNENNYAVDFELNNLGSRVCSDVAKYLGLDDIKPIQAIRDQYGIEIVLEGYDIVSNALCQENRIKDPAGFFFSTVNKLVNNNSP